MAKCQVVYELYLGKCVRGRETRVVFCGFCGYAHVFPKPTPEEMAEYYKSAYYTQEKPEYSRNQERIGEYLDVVNQEKILVLGPGEFMRRLAIDVGCGRETRWMKALQGAEYEPVGVDPCVRGNHEFVDGFSVTRDFSGYEHPACAAVISLNFVLEHVTDPRKVLVDCHRHLARDGKLLVEVPDDFNPDQMLIWDRGERKLPWWVSTPDHISYFRPGSLETLLRSCGFVPEFMRSTWPVEQLILQGHDYRVDPEAKKLVVSCRAEKQREWWALGKSARCSGRTIWCVARKA